jgi:hypothetical protein
VADCAAKLPQADNMTQAAELLYRRANAYLQCGDHHQAEREYAALLAQLAAAGAPPHLGALGNRGHALLALQRTAEALVPYTQLAALAPDDALAHYNRANVLKDLERLAEAEQGYRRALALKNDFAEAALELAHCLLSAGDFTAGWRQYERRWQTAQLRPHALNVAAPLWLGDAPLENKTILLWAEQGLGDTIQFARFVPMVADLADLAGRVVVRAPASLVPLLQSLDERVAVIADNAPLPACDLHCPLLSLPLALGVTVPPPMPGARRFQVDAAARERWQGWLTEAGAPQARPRIGLAWAGRQTGYVNRSRDVALAALWPLAAIDAAFISLQREMPASDAAALAQWPALIRAGALPADFLDLAALIDTLDIVVCVDSVIAHLAGSLGKPVMLLLRRSGEWRWNLPGAGSRDTPWYPSLRILRQEVQGDWAPVLARLRGELLVAGIQ